jgi:hypothetical protein
MPFVLILLLLCIYGLEILAGHWFDKQQEESFALQDITEVELQGRIVSVQTWLIGLIVMIPHQRRPSATRSLCSPTSTTPSLARYG